MPIRRGVVASSVTELPTATIGSVTNFNQDRATFNATISANYQSTTVKFQYNTTNNFSSFTEVTATGSPVTGQSTAVYFNATGLSVGTTYYVRAVATNGTGTVTTSSVSFTTWSVKTYANGTAGSYSLTLSTVTPTGSTAVIPAIHDVFILGGGGGSASNGGGGGGGGYRLVSSRAFTSTSNLVLSLAVGGGGGAASAGGTTTISASNFTSISAGGGGGGVSPPGSYTPNGASSGLNNGGTVGSGDNGANAGGTGVTFYNTKTNDLAQWGGGGGGGINGGGGGGYSSGSNTNSVGGNGGAGGTAYGYNGGAGGGGAGSDATGSVGSSSGYGTGGTGSGVGGSAGLIYFKYYGP
jgi:hypothetical protein